MLRAIAAHMENFTPLSSAIGGVLIGLSAAALMVFNGRIAGISGITAGLLTPTRGDLLWRALFALGLVAGGAAFFLAHPGAFAVTIDRSAPALIVAGLLVGIGTRLGSGCTSGHGVCGMSRFSRRSISATLTFIATGALTVWLVRSAFGGAL